MAERICFVIGPIGSEGTEVRRRSDMMLRHVIAPAALEHGYSVVRADQIVAAGVITAMFLYSATPASAPVKHAKRRATVRAAALTALLFLATAVRGDEVIRARPGAWWPDVDAWFCIGMFRDESIWLSEGPWLTTIMLPGADPARRVFVRVQGEVQSLVLDDGKEELGFSAWRFFSIEDGVPFSFAFCSPEREPCAVVRRNLLTCPVSGTSYLLFLTKDHFLCARELTQSNPHGVTPRLGRRPAGGGLGEESPSAGVLPLLGEATRLFLYGIPYASGRRPRGGLALARHAAGA